MSILKTFNHLYGKSSAGKTKEWWLEIIEDNNKTYIVTRSGYIDGKKTVSRKEIKSKNIGKVNETTPYEQACYDAESKMNKKTDEGYVENKAELDNQVLLLPMLAHHYKDRKHKVTWPAYASPKLDGNRLLIRYNNDATIDYLSRKGKKFKTLSHFDKYVDDMLSILKVSDGEIYKHGVPLQDIAAASKKENNLTSELEYWIFDCVHPEKTFEERWDIIKSYFDTYSEECNEFGYRKVGPFVEVPNNIVTNEEELQKYHDICTSSGFEGTMIRNTNGLYKIGHRSVDLLKKKDFLEEEFKIVGGKSAEGNDIGTVVFQCETSEGKVFDVRPKGTREKRREWLNNINNLIGKYLTVRFQYWSKDNIPCHVRGICVRDYE